MPNFDQKLHICDMRPIWEYMVIFVIGNKCFFNRLMRYIYDNINLKVKNSSAMRFNIELVKVYY